MRIRLDLDRETASRLVEAATIERRPVGWQASVLLRRALGLPFPPMALTEGDQREVIDATSR